ncbi:MAG: winged helix DNA-binding domain-containing protein [Oscillospiraceae bacterium]|nr:winged helix DNA-binding domain-containing protein [Oscillospiraceae bacterium]
MQEISKKQARRFMLLKHGLIGDYRFDGKPGALEFVKQAGCIQFDPVDVCGKNAELVLQSRVKGFTKEILHSLLYKDRELVDYFDKQLAIIPTSDWPYFERYRQAAREHVNKYPELLDFYKKAKEYIDKNGAVSSSDLPDEFDVKSNWFSAVNWSAGKNAARAVLEQMYSEGELIVYNKKGTRKYYDLSEKHIPAEILKAADPLPQSLDHLKWRVLRRIGAVGLLWNRPSDAWLGIWDLDSENRKECFRLLQEEKKITVVKVQGVNFPLFYRIEDEPLIKTALSESKLKPRCEVIAPLDCFIWDRKLIKEIFDYYYAWEIYHPPSKRQYGHYVLPMLYGETFAGRLEASVDRKSKIMTVKNIWYEEGFKQTKAFKIAENSCIKRLAKFNDCISFTR